MGNILYGDKITESYYGNRAIKQLISYAEHQGYKENNKPAKAQKFFSFPNTSAIQLKEI